MIHIRQNISLLPYNTFGIDATASRFIEFDTDGIPEVLQSLPDLSTAFILGGGSNVLFVSDRYDTVLHPVFKGIEIVDESAGHVSVRAQAGEVWDDFVDWCIQREYSGLENLSHIPGMVGACPIQNIGAYGVEVKDVIETVEAVDMTTGEKLLFTNKQCHFGYRDSFFKKNRGKYLIVDVRFRLSKEFVPEIRYVDVKTELATEPFVTLPSVRRAIINIRSRKLPDPLQLGSAGSFFKNPTIGAEQSAMVTKTDPQAPLYPIAPDFWKVSAAWLIQQAGWKGIRSGRVGTHQRQPLVIVNYGGATGQEILDFAGEIIRSVEDKFDIRLEPEVHIL